MNAITPSASPTNAVVAATTYTPSATALGGTVSISVDSTTSANCAINAGIVSFKAIGSCKINFSTSGNASYGSTSTSLTFGVGQGVNSITPSAPPTNAIVGGTTYTPSATALGGTVSISVDSTTSANWCDKRWYRELHQPRQLQD